MFTESRWQKINAYARERVSGNDSYHDIEHTLRTADTAIRLAVAERADRGICWAAAMLHDICKKEQGDHAAEGAKLAKRFLIDIGVDEQTAERVRDAIHFHNKDFDSTAPIERQVLWDSDKLYIETPEGFRKRMLPYWIMRKGRKAGIETAVEEYYFYKARFHTKTAIKEAGKCEKEMEQVIAGLKAEV